MSALEAQAKALYDTRGNRCTPNWDQLGEATKSVWRDYVRLGTRSCQAAAAAPAPTKEVGVTLDLF